MSATETQFVITDEELADAATPLLTYEALEPGDYEAVISKVEDYDNTQKGGSKGWIVTVRVDGLPFKVWIAHSTAARWKLIEFVHAVRPGFFDTRNDDGTTRPVPINDFVGDPIGVHVMLDSDMDTPRKVVDSFFSLTEEPPSIEDVPAL